MAGLTRRAVVAGPMRVREATTDDAGAVNSVHRAAIRELGPGAYDERQVAAWLEGGEPRSYPIDAADTGFLAADIDGDVVGFGWLDHDPGGHLSAPVEGEVTAVYVAPSVARRGVGTALLDALEERARDADLGSLGLRASLNAVPFYEARGYERVAERSHEFGGEVEGRILEMRTKL